MICSSQKESGRGWEAIDRIMAVWSLEKPRPVWSANRKFGQVSNYSCQTTPGVFLPVLTLGGTSSRGAGSWGEGLGWGWGCGSVRAGVDDVEDGDEDGGGWWCSWLLRRWRFSKLGASGSLKECNCDTTGGAVAQEFDATLPLLFTAATWERTL